MTLDKSSTTTLITSRDKVVPYSYLVSNTGTSELTGSASSTQHDAAPSCPHDAGGRGFDDLHRPAHGQPGGAHRGPTSSMSATVSSNEAPDATDTVSTRSCGGPTTPERWTMGFWQNKNGQGIIKDQAKTGGAPLLHG